MFCIITLRKKPPPQSVTLSPSRLNHAENPVPESIRLAVEGTNDLTKLGSWCATALAVETIGEVRKQMKLEP